MKVARSKKDFERAKKILVGGVNSPVRAYAAVGGTPRFIASARGSAVTDVDGNRYVDFVMSWGAVILGHAFAPAVKAVKAALEKGSTYGAPTEKETELAGLIRGAFPSMEKVRLVSSGTEAAMSCVRLARGYTGRTKIIKFEGCYHGHSDSLLIRAGSGAATFGIPDSAGIPGCLAKETIVLPFNDIRALEEAMRRYGKETACVIVEPVAANMGVVLPERGFLEALRRLTRKYAAVLVFDEVISGFRLAFGGAQGLYGISPDLTCLGKIIGGGLPLAAFGGSGRIMERLAPLGDVYQAGTLSGNPCAAAAGIAVLTDLKHRDYSLLDEKAAGLCDGLRLAFSRQGIPIAVNRCGGVFTLFFSPGKVRDFSSAKRSDTRSYGRYFHHMLEEGINLPPSQFEANFVSFCHSAADIRAMLAAARRAAAAMKGS